MSTFAEIRRRNQVLARAVEDYTGVDRHIVINVIQYAKQLTPKNNPEVIDELVFVAQMGIRFGITSRFHVQLMFESMRMKTYGKTMRLEDYVRMICIFYSPRLDVKIDFVFSVYDFKQDGFLELNEITALLKTSIISVGEDHDPAEALTDLINLVLNVTDLNQDGLISREEFRTYVKRDILCIQLFGKVFPDVAIFEMFMQLMKTKHPTVIKDLFTNERSICLHEPIVKQKENPLYPGVNLDM